MAIINASQIELRGVHADAVEVPHRHTPYSLCFREPKSTRLKQVIYTSKQMIRDDRSGLLRPIDTRWTDDRPRRNAFETKSADYSAKLRADFNDGDILEISAGKAKMSMRPVSLEWVNDKGATQEIAKPKASRGDPLDGVGFQQAGARGRIKFQHCYGPYISVSVLARTNTIEKALCIVKGLHNLPQPKIDGEVWLQHNLIYTIDAPVVVDDKPWDGKPVKVKEHVRFDGTPLMWSTPRGHDHSPGRTRVEGELFIERTDVRNEILAHVRFPLSWLESAMYPVRMDPEIVVNPAEASEYALNSDNSSYILRDLDVWNSVLNGTGNPPYNWHIGYWYAVGNVSWSDIGEGYYYHRIERGLTRFDTSAIGSGTVSEVSLSLVHMDSPKLDDGPFDLLVTEAYWDADMVSNWDGSEAWASGLSAANPAVWNTITDELATDTPMDVSLRAEYINGSGFTPYMFMADRDYYQSQTPPTGYNQVFLGAAQNCFSYEHPPVLSVTYEEGAAGAAVSAIARQQSISGISFLGGSR